MLIFLEKGIIVNKNKAAENPSLFIYLITFS